MQQWHCTGPEAVRRHRREGLASPPGRHRQTSRCLLGSVPQPQCGRPHNVGLNCDKQRQEWIGLKLCPNKRW